MKRFLLALPVAGVMMTSPFAFAQTPAAPENPADGAATTNSTECVDLSEEVPPAGTPDTAAQGAAIDGDTASETPPAAGPNSGTAPGGAGSSGWTGGTGGSDIGTSQSEEVDSSPQQDHPAVASGLDPITGETAVEGPQAPPKPQPQAAATANC